MPYSLSARSVHKISKILNLTCELIFNFYKYHTLFLNITFSYLYMNFQPCKMDYLIAILFVWNHRALKLTFLMVENGKTRANNYWDRCFEMKIDRPPHYQPHDLLNKFPLYLKMKKRIITIKNK